MKIRITYYGNEGTFYSVIEDYEKDEIELGKWDSPFPNEKNGSTMAFGIEECLLIRISSHGSKTRDQIIKGNGESFV